MKNITQQLNKFIVDDELLSFAIKLTEIPCNNWMGYLKNYDVEFAGKVVLIANILLTTDDIPKEVSLKHVIEYTAEHLRIVKNA